MFKSLLGVLSLGVVTTPLYAPSTPCIIDNKSSSTFVWVNKATDEETLIQPYSSVSVASLSGYALSSFEYQHSSSFIFAVDKSNASDRYYTQDVAFDDGLYTDFQSSDTKVTIYDNYYYGDVYLDFSSFDTDPFSEDFYYMFGTNESQYASMGSNGLVRSSTLFTGNFNIYGDVPSAYNIQYTSLVALANIYRVGNTYSKENVRASVSILALRSSSHKAVEIASNYTNRDFEVLHVSPVGSVIDNYDVLCWAGPRSDANFRSMAFNGGISNNIWSAGFNVYTPQQAKYISYKKSVLPVSDTETDKVLDDFFSLMAKAFAVLIPFFGVVVFPGVTIGLLLLIPLFVALIIALLKMIKK